MKQYVNYYGGKTKEIYENRQKEIYKMILEEYLPKNESEKVKKIKL